MYRRRTLTIQQQITLLAGTLCLALVAAAAGGAAYMGKRQTRELIETHVTDMATVMAHTLDRDMYERFREVRILAESRTVRGMEPDALRALLTRRQSSMIDFAWVGVADPAGNVVASTQGQLEGKSVANRLWFKHGLESPYIGDVRESKLLGELLGRDQRQAFRFVEVAAPVVAGGRTVGVLGAHLSWTWAAEVRRAMLENDTAGGIRDLWILSSDGTMLLGPHLGSKPFDDARIAAMLRSRQGVFESDSENGMMLTGYAIASGYRDYPGRNWLIIAQQPARDAYAAVRRLEWGALVLSILIAIAGVTLTWFIARRIASPLRALTAAARDLGRDHSVTMLPRLAGAREIVDLSAALRSLMRRLGVEQERADLVQRQAQQEEKRYAQEISELRRAAGIDPLSGLLNRRAFLYAAAMMMADANARHLTVIMADIDFFKQVNDNHGHSAGDATIRKVGEILTACVRETDLVARFGGEEFVILLAGTPPGAVLALTERMRRSVQETPITHGAATIRITISLGVAIADPEDRDIQNVIEGADRALYRAKQRGRNRAVLSA
ncbi:sensor domain-containing diguanylate cyclase [Achromobacter aloeverae]|uniref:diguanylate cyclase n=1 Tax=Achromobacter aloeverae TaxID=1750518 RepID=A0A4Q1HC25_9BURK|nr:sensor domain-containing diguanylate cyclase [Achromobacter aloeverae]RXN83198.1 sensor domain-containing diguanylate cyclase [Achromobacter aloeverae]